VDHQVVTICSWRRTRLRSRASTSHSSFLTAGTVNTAVGEEVVGFFNKDGAVEELVVGKGFKSEAIDGFDDVVVEDAEYIDDADVDRECK
jgi:hypothetical protein